MRRALHAAYFRPGGVHQDISDDLIDDIEAWALAFPEVMDDIDGLLTENRIFKQRNADIGVISEEDILNYGFSGVMVRGSGLAWDLRRAQPYECYDEFEFQIPVGKNGDCYDRYLVRMEEMRQSCRMVLDALNKIPGGKNTNYANGDEMIYTKAPTRAPEGATGFSNYECTRGASQFYIQGGGEGRGKNPYRVSIRSPMFITIPYVAKTMIGYKVADIPAIMGSFDPCIGETDR